MPNQSKCPICTCATTSPFQRLEMRWLLICHSCRHIFWQEMPSEVEVAEYYASAYTQGHAQYEIQRAAEDYYRAHARELARATGKEKGMRIADIGCSVPVFLKCAREGGAETIGVDYSKDAKVMGSSWDVLVTTPDEFPNEVPDGSLDIIRYSHALEHMLDPLSALAMHATKLRSGGLVYITQPNFPVLALCESNVSLEDAVWPEHLHFFNPISIVQICKRANLTITRLFSADAEDARAEKYSTATDLAYAAEQLKDIQVCGDPFFGSLNNWPNYFGANITTYARKDVI